VMIAGFAISSPNNLSRSIIVDALGPTLAGAPFNLSGTISGTSINLYSGYLYSGSTIIASNSGYLNFGGSDAAALDSRILKRPIFSPTNSAESLVVDTLAPGSYTVVVSGSGGATGLASVNLYEFY
jgi:hypothetical protein